MPSRGGEEGSIGVGGGGEDGIGGGLVLMEMAEDCRECVRECEGVRVCCWWNCSGILGDGGTLPRITDCAASNRLGRRLRLVASADCSELDRERSGGDEVDDCELCVFHDLRIDLRDVAALSAVDIGRGGDVGGSGELGGTGDVPGDLRESMGWRMSKP
jgi:hypothetical protein